MKKSIGILGGMGPLATSDLFRKIVFLTKADSDREHIRIFIDNNAQIPDRTEAILSGGADPVPEMLSALRNLERCGADCIIMPCNTAHYFLPSLQAATSIPFISMLEVTAEVCASVLPGKRAGILATTGTLRSGLYNKSLGEKGVHCVLPSQPEQEALMYAIYEGVKKGVELFPLRDSMLRVLEGMTQRGADYFVLACTEMPIIQEVLDLPGLFIDPTVELAKAAIRFCGYRVRENGYIQEK